MAMPAQVMLIGATDARIPSEMPNGLMIEVEYHDQKNPTTRYPFTIENVNYDDRISSRIYQSPKQDPFLPTAL